MASPWLEIPIQERSRETREVRWRRAAAKCFMVESRSRLPERDRVVRML